MSLGNYRKLNADDLNEIATKKRHNFINCRGHFFALYKNNQAVIITNESRAKRIKHHLENRHAQIINEITKNNKAFLLIQCENVASIRAMARRLDIKPCEKTKRALGINDLLIK